MLAPGRLSLNANRECHVAALRNRSERTCGASRGMITHIVQTHSLMPLLASVPRLRAAARFCMRRSSGAGIDSCTWRKYRESFTDRLRVLSGRLFNGSWRPSPVLIRPKVTFAGKLLFVAIPTVEDRIVHRAIRNCIEPILDKYVLLDFVSGFRRGRSRIDAVRRATVFLESGRTWVSDIDVKDISKGSTTIEVIEWLAELISDGSFLSLFRVTLDGLPSPLFPGSGFAPLLVNLRLARVDVQLRDLPVVRFGDNYCVFARTHDESLVHERLILDILQQQGLAAAPEKSRIRHRPNPEDLFLMAG